MEGDFKFPEDHDRNLQGRPPISNDAKSLIRYILNTDQRHRPSLQQILAHKFFTAPDDHLPLVVIPLQLPQTILTHPLSEEFVGKLRAKGLQMVGRKFEVESYTETMQGIMLSPDPGSLQLD